MVHHELEALEPLASRDHVPLIQLFPQTRQAAAEIGALNPDLILVSCYAHRIADELLALPRLGAFNIHPSLLPAFRGPTPLFWQFRKGVQRFGLSLHRMTAEFDSGPVICQQAIPMMDGVSIAEANDLLARQAENLLAAGLAMIERGGNGLGQSSADASYQTYPEASDFTLSTQWTARRMYNFMRATAHFGQAYACRIEGQLWRLKHALEYTARGECAVEVDMTQVLKIDCAVGSLLASYYY